MERMSSSGRRISTQYTQSCHSASTVNQTDWISRRVGHLKFRSSKKIGVMRTLE